MSNQPTFPTSLHRATAELVRDHFLSLPNIDTVLVVNSCARGKAVPTSDLDFAILAASDTPPEEINKMETAWLEYATSHPLILKYKQSSPFAHLHLDVINGNYTPAIFESGGPIDYFEVEIGNQLRYSAPMDQAGPFFRELQNKWLPYYPETLRRQRLIMARKACAYDLDHIPLFIKRDLYFQAFDILYKAFQEYLQTLFIAHKTYPIAYNKWIKEQIVASLNRPDLYPRLSPILSVSNIESDEINGKANLLRQLLNNIENT